MITGFIQSRLRGAGGGASSLRAFIGAMLLASVAISLIFNIAQGALGLLSGMGIDDFLGWVDHRNTLDAVLEYWRSTSLLQVSHVELSLDNVALAFLTMDSAHYIPTYSVLLLGIASWLRREFEADGARSRGWPHFTIAAAAVSLLVASDFVENMGGFLRFDASWGGLVATAIGLSGTTITLMFWLGSLDSNERAVLRRPTVWVGSVIALLAILVGIGIAFYRHGPLDWLLITSRAHAVKKVMLLSTGVVLLALVALWFFGFQIDAQSPNGAARALQRARLRVGVFDVIRRSRYVLIGLVVFGFLTATADQARDLIVGLAGNVSPDRNFFVGLVAIAVTALAAWSYAFVCWTWTRLAAAVKAPDVNDASRDEVDSFSQLWARILGLAPFLILAGVAGPCVHDAVLDDKINGRGSSGPEPIILAPAILVLFGVLFIVLGALFLRNRSRQSRYVPRLEGDHRYYNDERLCGFGHAKPVARETAKFRLLGLRPLELPCLALVMMLVLRGVSNSESLGPIGTLLAFAIILLALTWWTGVFGWLSLSEITSARPWGLFLLGAAGVIGFVGAAENHVVPLISENADTTLLYPSLLAAITIATLVALVLIESRERGLQPASRTFLERRIEWVRRHPQAVIIVVAYLAILGVTARANFAGKPGADTAFHDDSRRTLSSEHMPDPCGTPTQDPTCHVYLVAAEGGGIRAAYWTALELQQLAEKDPHFLERTFALSGASGGSLGEAVFMACFLKDAAPDHVRACIDKLGSLDLLTPTLGPLLFEDVLARIIPTSLCKRPACGFLSRGLYFEQRLERLDSHLSARFEALRPDSTTRWWPHLLFNSTWVETGERTIASTLRIDHSFPAARDELAVLGTSATDKQHGPLRQLAGLRASTVAHNSARFPFVNGLGAMRCADKSCSSFETEPVSRGRIFGHLADGGFFDDRAAHTIIDVLNGLPPAMRPKVQVILIRNDKPNETNCDATDRTEPRAGCIVPLFARPQSPPPDAEAHVSTLHLYVDLLGPVVTTFNVSGVKANGQRAAALLAANACAANPDDGLRLLDQIRIGALIPRGWYLSPQAAEALRVQSKQVLEESGKKDAANCRPCSPECS